jgi:hypothetical protein
VCGQNILISSHPVPWFFTIESWWLEKDLFTYGGQNKLSEVGLLYFFLEEFGSSSGMLQYNLNLTKNLCCSIKRYVDLK